MPDLEGDRLADLVDGAGPIAARPQEDDFTLGLDRDGQQAGQERHGGKQKGEHTSQGAPHPVVRDAEAGSR
jgi:hypothetical protein